MLFVVRGQIVQLKAVPFVDLSEGDRQRPTARTSDFSMAFLLTQRAQVPSLLVLQRERQMIPLACTTTGETFARLLVRSICFAGESRPHYGH